MKAKKMMEQTHKFKQELVETTLEPNTDIFEVKQMKEFDKKLKSMTKQKRPTKSIMH